MIVILIGLIILSACFAGLSLGLFSLSLDSLERKIKMGNKDAERIYKVRKNSSRLLCTLLLGNVAVNAAIPLLMQDYSSGGLVAGLLTTTIIFLLCEVAPQAIVTRHAFAVASKTTWLVRIFMLIMSPVAYPLSKALDYIFGKELAEPYNKSELEIIIDENPSNFDSDEKRIMSGAMNFSEKTTLDVITPVNVLFALEANTLIDKPVLNTIINEHYSRIPVYDGDRDNIIGILFAKDLIGYNTDSNLTVKEVAVIGSQICVGEDYQLDSLLNMFIKSKRHMGFVYNQFNSLTGIVTLEDIIETILKVEILDERDTVSDLQHLAKSFNKVKLTTKEVTIE